MFWGQTTHIPEIGKLSVKHVLSDMPPRGPETKNVRKITYCGETLTIPQWARKLGVPVTLLHRRLRSPFWTVEAALSEPPKKSPLLEFNGERKTVAEWARATGIDRCTIWRRINVLGWTVEDALTKGTS